MGKGSFRSRVDEDAWKVSYSVNYLVETTIDGKYRFYRRDETTSSGAAKTALFLACLFQKSLYAHVRSRQSGRSTYFGIRNGSAQYSQYGFSADSTALSLWPIFIEPALTSSPSALSRIKPGQPPLSESDDPPQFTTRHFELWIEFQTKKGKAISKDTWNLFVDFVRTIDADFKEYDEEGRSLSFRFGIKSDD